MAAPGRITFLLIALWAVAIAAGLWAGLDFEHSPGKTRSASARWPADSALAPDDDLPTLVVFLHPKCPCSRASLAELERLKARCRDRLALHLVFVRPKDLAEGWEQTDLWKAASRLDGATLSCDVGGLEAARFGSTVSGESLLYAADGRLLFQGGLTASRGHEGENAGRAAIVSLIESGRAETSRTVVFGCELERDHRRSQ